MTRYEYEARRFDTATVTVVLEGPMFFSFPVGDWDTDEEPLSHEHAHEMARGLIFEDGRPDGMPLHGKLSGSFAERDVMLTLDTRRVITFYVTPTGV